MKIKAEITIDGTTASVVFKKGKTIVLWEQLTRKEQISISESFFAVNNLFAPFIKE
jgi:hypothetical protein